MGLNLGWDWLNAPALWGTFCSVVWHNRGAIVESRQ